MVALPEAFEAHFPVGELFVELFPIFGMLCRVDVGSNLRHAVSVAVAALLLHNFTAVNVAFEYDQNLSRTDGLEQKVGNLFAYGLIH